MKRLLTLFLAVCLVATLVPAPFGFAVSAESEEYYTYSVSDGKATITRVDTSISGDVTIPETLGGYPVTAIGMDAFYACRRITSITIPSSVTFIASRAFYFCTSLKSADIPGSITAFGDDIFYGCTKLESVSLGYGITRIGKGAFGGCTSLTSITIPQSVVSIGSSVFSGCTSLTSITIPDSVTFISNEAFSRCTSLANVYFEKTEIWKVGTTKLSNLENPQIAAEYLTSTYCSFGWQMINSYYKYSVTDSNATITSVDTSITGDVTIPEALDGYQVTSIGSSAFSNCTNLTSITIPDSIKSIDRYAFSHCTNLASVSLGNGITFIGEFLFSGCPGIESLTVDENNPVYHSDGNCIIETETAKLIFGCKNSVIPTDGSVKAIGSRAFSGCTNLTSITIPKSVTDIQSGAFSGCTSLTSIIIPDSVTLIGNEAFLHCTNLKNVYFEKTEIWKADTTKLSNLEDPQTAAEYLTSTYSRCSWKRLSTYYTYVIVNGKVTITDVDTSITGDVTIPQTLDGCPVTAISYGAFRDCQGLTSITIPKSITSIGNSTFSGCTNLENVYFENTEIWKAGTTKLTNLEDPQTAAEYLKSTYSNYSWKWISTYYTYETVDGNATITGVDTSITGDVTIPQTLDGYPVTAIGSSAFRDCANLTSITIPESVISISKNAFLRCTNLKNVYFEKLEFWKAGTTSLSELDNSQTAAEYLTNTYRGYDWIRKNTYYIYEITDGKAKITGIDILISGDVTIPQTLDGYPVTAIGANVFRSCTNLTSVTIPDGVTSIGKYAFSYCTNLTSVTMPDGVTSIGEYAFSNCTNLASVTMPDGVTSIGEYAFSNCTNLTSITIPESVMSISRNAFSRCTNLKNAYFEKTEIWKAGTTRLLNLENPQTAAEYLTSTYSSVAWNLVGPYTYSVTDGEVTITEVDFSLAGDIVIPETLGGYPVTAIGDYVFRGRTDITSVTIPDGVKSIGFYAFNNCTNLESVSLGYGIAYIEMGAFGGCRSLTSITLPDSVTEIAGDAFSNCTNLTSITIPKSVTAIATGTFSGCASLESITVDENNPVYHSDGNCLIQTEWGELILGCKYSVIPTNGSVTSIGHRAFSGCTGLTSVDIPDSITFIDVEAFSGCTNLASVSLGDGVAYIRTGAFEDCQSVKSITIPDSVTFIDYAAFSGCTSLTSINIPDSVTSIGSGTFRDCANLTSITIPQSVVSIGIGAFSGCTSLTNVYFEKTTLWKADSTSLVNLENPQTAAKYLADTYCTASWAIVSPYRYTVSNGNATITGVDTSISGDVTIPETLDGYPVVAIDGFDTFTSCPYITGVTIPDGVTHIGSNTFRYCENLKSITIPASVTFIGVGAFHSCVSLESITVDENNPVYHSDGNCLIETKTKRLIRGSNKSVIPDDGSVTSIDDAFIGYTNLTSITIPDGIISIGGAAFYRCTNLAVISIPKSVTYIDSNAFYECPSVESITVDENNPVYHSYGNCLIETATKTLIKGSNNAEIPTDGSVTTIGVGAFYFLQGIKSVTLGNSVTSIEEYAFYGCSNLVDIYFKGTKAEWEKIDKGVSEKEEYWDGKTGDYTLHFIGTVNCGIDDTYHYYECTECDEFAGLMHIYDTPCDTTCNDCGYERKITHTFGKWALQDDGGYKRECKYCDVFETMRLDEDKPIVVTPTENVANTNINNTDIEIIENVLSDEEQSKLAAGADVKISLTVENISEEVSSEHKSEAEEKAGDSEIVMYLDIDLYKQVGDEEETQVTETVGKVSITITIPDDLINTDDSVTRIYKVIRVHEDENGELITDVIGGVFNGKDNTFTFETDKFSTYALAYEDSDVKPGDVDNSGNVDANDAIYLLYRVFFGEESYKVVCDPDVDGNGSVEANDAIYLLYHVFFGANNYPLYPGKSGETENY